MDLDQSSIIENRVPRIAYYRSRWQILFPGFRTGSEVHADLLYESPNARAGNHRGGWIGAVFSAMAVVSTIGISDSDTC